jgi:hypothetical protein
MAIKFTTKKCILVEHDWDLMTDEPYGDLEN